MRFTVIAAVAENGVIGRHGTLPWRLPDDLRRFKALTMGHAVIVGRRTYESIGRLLPGRTMVILTRNPQYRVPGAMAARSLEEALARLEGEEEVFAAGGEAVFREALPRASRLYLTRVHASLPGDVRLSEDLLVGWELVSEEHHPADPRHRHAFTFQVYQKEAAARG